MNKILIFTAFYIPGYKGGGPIRSIANIVDTLGDDFNFKLITRDRDFGDTEAYKEINSDTFQRVGNADVLYLSPKKLSPLSLCRRIRSIDYDAIYLNSFFNFYFTIIPLLLMRFSFIPSGSIILASRGEFSPGALAIKSFKKRIYIALAKMLGLYKNVLWHASSEHEAKNIRRYFGKKTRIFIVPNLASPYKVTDNSKEEKNKEKGHLKIIFLSRISRKKNLDGALNMLKELKGKVEFNIYGPIEDEIYWAECNNIISDLPENIKVEYCGSIEHNEVNAVMREHDIFFFPTHGENFGHVILEAFCAACPVVISDQTPWLNLDKKGVGYDLPLDKPERFVDILQKWIDMNNLEYMLFHKKAREYGMKFATDKHLVEETRQLFCQALKFNND